MEAIMAMRGHQRYKRQPEVGFWRGGNLSVPLQGATNGQSAFFNARQQTWEHRNQLRSHYLKLATIKSTIPKPQPLQTRKVHDQPSFMTRKRNDKLALPAVVTTKKRNEQAHFRVYSSDEEEGNQGDDDFERNMWIDRFDPSPKHGAMIVPQVERKEKIRKRNKVKRIKKVKKKKKSIAGKNTQSLPQIDLYANRHRVEKNVDILEAIDKEKERKRRDQLRMERRNKFAERARARQEEKMKEKQKREEEKQQEKKFKEKQKQRLDRKWEKRRAKERASLDQGISVLQQQNVQKVKSLPALAPSTHKTRNETSEKSPKKSKQKKKKEGNHVPFEIASPEEERDDEVEDDEEFDEPFQIKDMGLSSLEKLPSALAAQISENLNSPIDLDDDSVASHDKSMEDDEDEGVYTQDEYEEETFDSSWPIGLGSPTDTVEDTIEGSFFPIEHNRVDDDNDVKPVVRIPELEEAQNHQEPSDFHEGNARNDDEVEQVKVWKDEVISRDAEEEAINQNRDSDGMVEEETLDMTGEVHFQEENRETLKECVRAEPTVDILQNEEQMVTVEEQNLAEVQCTDAELQKSKTEPEIEKTPPIEEQSLDELSDLDEQTALSPLSRAGSPVTGHETKVINPVSPTFLNDGDLDDKEPAELSPLSRDASPIVMQSPDAFGTVN